MIHQEYGWERSKAKRIYAQSWMPETGPKAIINLLHGMGGHSGRFARWAGLFTEEGYGVLAPDLVGHGKSDGRRGHVRSYRVLMNQVDQLLNQSEQLFPGIPRILYGQSLGGNLAINYAISGDPPVHALIAASPWLKLVHALPPHLQALKGIGNHVFPRVRIKRKGSTEILTHDPEIWKNIREDPLNHPYISARFYSEIERQGEFALHHVYRINKPFLLMHGDGDQVTSCRASEQFVANTSERTRLKVWPGLFHELHNEFEYQEIFAYVHNWLKEIME